MTTSPATYSTSNAFPELVERWDASMRQLAPTFEPFTRIHDAESAAIRRWADLPIGRLPDWDGSADLGNSGVANAYGATRVQTLTPDGKGTRVELTQFDVRHSPGLVERKLGQLRDAVTKTMESLVYGVLASSFTDTVDNGAGGTITIINTAHRYADAGAGDGVLDQTDNSNKLTTALSASSLASGVTLMQNFKDDSGEPYGLGTGP